jgi:hypothetical protein
MTIDRGELAIRQLKRREISRFGNPAKVARVLKLGTDSIGVTS